MDYGNTETTSLSRVRQLCKDFSVLPAQALCCAAQGASNVSFSASQLQEFRNRYDFSDLSGMFANINMHLNNMTMYILNSLGMFLVAPLVRLCMF